jgi:tetratricopeptide (TPR) repeat protein
MHGYSAALINLAAEMEGLNDYDRATELNEQALAVSRRIGDAAGLAVSLGNLAEYAGRSGDIEGARERFADALAASRAMQSAHRLTEQYWQVGFFELSAGHPGRAREAFEHALTQADAAGLDDYEIGARAYAAFAAVEMGDADAAEIFRREAVQAFANSNIRVFAQVRLTYQVMRAALDAAAGDLMRASRGLGAIDGSEEEEGSTLWWTLSGLRERVREEVQAGLSEAEFAAALEEGRDLSLDEAIDLITAST